MIAGKQKSNPFGLGLEVLDALGGVHGAVQGLVCKFMGERT